MASTPQICGTFSDPTNPNQGQCAPYRLKRSCEAPVKPSPFCGDSGYTITYDPQIGEFRAIAAIYDGNCVPVTDGGVPITGPVR